jgi:hypothetical protein
VPQKEARDEAIRRARERLGPLFASGGQAVRSRCAALGLGAAAAGGAVEFMLFGREARLEIASGDLAYADGAEPPQGDRILFYHYLACESAPQPGGDPISFRDFPGGAFYWEPFRSRTSLPLAKRYGADIATGSSALREALSRFDSTELALGDFGARVRGFGNLYLILAAYAPEESPDAELAFGLDAEFNVLFEPAARRAFGAEDAAAFASRICLALL